MNRNRGMHGATLVRSPRCSVRMLSEVVLYRTARSHVVTPSVRTSAVLFDLDDTLYDHGYASRQALGTLRHRYSSLRGTSLPVLEGEYHALMNRLHPLTLSGQLPPQAARQERLRRLFRDHGERLSDAETRRRAAVYRTAYLASERAIPGSESVVRSLWSRGYRLGVVTNNAVQGQRRKLVVCGLDRYVRVLVVSQAVRVSKPHPQIFEIALHRLRATADRAVMVGDSFESDVIGAQRAGIPAVWFHRDGGSAPGRLGVPEIRSWRPASAAIRTIVSAFAARSHQGSPR